MVNSTQVITIDDVRTEAERIHFLDQECTLGGLTASLYTYFGGLVGIPLLFKTVHRYIPMPMEYKIASGAVFSIAISYFAGVHYKRRCEEDIKRQLDEKLNA